MFAYQDLVDIGDMIGLRAYSTGPGVFADTDFQSLDDVKSVVSRYKKYYRTNSLKSYLVGNRRQREWMVESCKELGVMPTTEGGIDAKLDLTHIIDGFAGNEHSFPIVPLYKDVVELNVEVRYLLHANFDRGLWRALGGKLLLRDHRSSRRSEGSAFHPA